MLIGLSGCVPVANVADADPQYWLANMQAEGRFLVKKKLLISTV
jgi:hypothetical protein